MDIRILQRGFNFSQDGPGNRLVYHLQGCTMHCPWCSNPESIAKNGSILAAGAEADAFCPHGAVQNGVPSPSVCASCDKPCLEKHSKHLRLSCTVESVDDVLREIEGARMLFFDGGGVTFTGGEATLQFDALSALLTALHEKGIHTALETNGSHPKLPELFERIDYLIMDFKHWDAQTHQRIIGTSNRQTLQNIYAAAAQRTQLLVRIPLIGGFNDRVQDAEQFAEALQVLRDGHTVEVLRYHEYGKDKWAQCGMPYTMQNAFISDDTYRSFCRTLQSKGLHLIHT